MLDLWSADARHQGPRSARRVAEVMRLRKGVAAELRRNPPLAVAELLLGGKDVMEILGNPVGREVGEGLRHLLEVVLDDPEANTRPLLSAHLRDWWRARHGGAKGSGGS